MFSYFSFLGLGVFGVFSSVFVQPHPPTSPPLPLSRTVGSHYYSLSSFLSPDSKLSFQGHPKP